MSSPNAHAFAFGSRHGGVQNPYTTGHQQRFSPRLRQKYDGGPRPSYIYPNHPSSHSSAFDTNPYQRRFFARESAQQEFLYPFSPGTHRVQPNRLQFASSRNHYNSSPDMEETDVTVLSAKKRSLPQSSTKKRQQKRQKKNSSKRRIIQESSSDNSSHDSPSHDDTPKKPRAKTKAARTKTNTSQVRNNQQRKAIPPPPCEPIMTTMTT